MRVYESEDMFFLKTYDFIDSGWILGKDGEYSYGYQGGVLWIEIEDYSEVLDLLGRVISEARSNYTMEAYEDLVVGDFQEHLRKVRRLREELDSLLHARAKVLASGVKVIFCGDDVVVEDGIRGGQYLVRLEEVEYTHTGREGNADEVIGWALGEVTS